MAAPFEGGCRCGAIRYTCNAEPLVSLHCYCRDCQYASGTACSTGMAVLADAVTVRGAAPITHTVTSASGGAVSRMFCGTCGTPLFAKSPKNPLVLAIRVGSLDDPSVIEPAAHIWTDSAPQWACMTQGLASFPGELPTA